MPKGTKGFKKIGKPRKVIKLRWKCHKEGHKRAYDLKFKFCTYLCLGNFAQNIPNDIVSKIFEYFQ